MVYLLVALISTACGFDTNTSAASLLCRPVADEGSKDIYWCTIAKLRQLNIKTYTSLCVLAWFHVVQHYMLNNLTSWPSA